MPTESRRMGGERGAAKLVWCWLGPCSIWCLQGLACVLPWPGGVGGGPIWAPSQNLPLPLVTATSLLCLAWVQPPHTSPLRGAAPPSKSPRTERPQPGAGPLQSSVSSSGNKKDWPFCAFRSCPSGILRTPESLRGCLHFLQSTPPGALHVSPQCHLGLCLAVHPQGGCSLSEPQFLTHKME